MNRSFRQASGWLCILLLTASACSNPLQRRTPTQPSPSETPSPVPTETFTPTPSPTPDIGMPDAARLVELDMTDPRSGWSWASDGSGQTWLLHTEDGAVSWQIVTPQIPATFNLSKDLGFFLDSDSAWLLIHNPTGGEAFFVHTRNGGSTWTSVPLTIDFDRFVFTSENEGWGQFAETHGGSWFMHLYRTSDSGRTWTPVTLPPPPSYNEVSDTPGVFQGCNTCGDSLYYDPSRAILFYSDQYSEPANAVRMSITVDQGKTWHDLELPLPAPEPPGGQVYAQWPAFVDGRNGFLTVRITNQAFPNEDTYDLFAVYVTHDGGLNWNLGSAIDNPDHRSDPAMQFFSSLNGFTECVGFLCATQDGAQTWQPFASKAQFASEGSGRPVFLVDFVGPQAGWILSGTIDNKKIDTTLWATGDGGLTWSQTAFSQVAPLPASLELDELHMLDALTGWAWDLGPGPDVLYRTADGGLTWTDVTPQNKDLVPRSSFFLDGGHAWIEIVDPASGRSGFLTTADGGKTWTAYTAVSSSPARFQFLNASDGWQAQEATETGQITFSVSETHDGGATWTPVVLSAPLDAPLPVEQPGTIQLCAACRDLAYYDPSRLMIIYGNMQAAAGQPLGLLLSNDNGVTWIRADLPLPPVQAADGFATADSPVFFDDLNGLLPVKITNPGSPVLYSVLAIYSTDDRGETWTRRPAVLDHVERSDRVQFISSTEAFVRCGDALCVTHDAGESWQSLSANWSFSPASPDEHAFQWEFVDADHGWVISGTDPDGKTTLWMTEDGGQSWTILTPTLAP